jgi:predicted phage gp36 major capsid-like protein
VVVEGVRTGEGVDEEERRYDGALKRNERERRAWWEGCDRDSTFRSSRHRKDRAAAVGRTEQRRGGGGGERAIG